MKGSYDNTCRLQRKAAFQVHCMKRRRINATERDHYTIEELHILIIWLHPTLEISIVNWFIFLRRGNLQCTEFLRELTGQNTLKNLENMQKWSKQMIKHEKPNNLLFFNHLMILHWQRAKQLSRLCLHCYGNLAYHAHGVFHPQIYSWHAEIFLVSSFRRHNAYNQPGTWPQFLHAFLNL